MVSLQLKGLLVWCRKTVCDVTTVECHSHNSRFGPHLCVIASNIMTRGDSLDYNRVVFVWRSCSSDLVPRERGYACQWRIQDGPQRGCQTSQGVQQTFPKNCIKMKTSYDQNRGGKSVQTATSVDQPRVLKTWYLHSTLVTENSRSGADFTYFTVNCASTVVVVWLKPEIFMRRIDFLLFYPDIIIKNQKKKSLSQTTISNTILYSRVNRHLQLLMINNADINAYFIHVNRIRTNLMITVHYCSFITDRVIRMK